VEALFYVFLLYFYIPLIYGGLTDNALKNGFANGKIFSYLVVRFKFSSYEERFLIVFSLIFIFAIPTAIYASLPIVYGAVAKKIGMFLVVAVMAMSSLYAITSKKIHEIYIRYSGRLNFIMAVSAAINLSRATSYAESIITDFVGMRASELPTGLAWISLIMVPIAWLVTLTIGALAIYAVALFSTSFVDSPRNSHVTSLQVPIARKVFRELAPGYAIAFSFAILAVSPLTIVSKVLSTTWAERLIREELVSASFHSKAGRCGIDFLPDAKVAYLEAGKAIIAIPHESLGYIFRPIGCSEIWYSAKQLEGVYNTLDPAVDG